MTQELFDDPRPSATLDFETFKLRYPLLVKYEKLVRKHLRHDVALTLEDVHKILVYEGVPYFEIENIVNFILESRFVQAEKIETARPNAAYRQTTLLYLKPKLPSILEPHSFLSQDALLKYPKCSLL